MFFTGRKKMKRPHRTDIGHVSHVYICEIERTLARPQVENMQPKTITIKKLTRNTVATRCCFCCVTVFVCSPDGAAVFTSSSGETFCCTCYSTTPSHCYIYTCSTMQTRRSFPHFVVNIFQGGPKYVSTSYIEQSVNRIETCQ